MEYKVKLITPTMPNFISIEQPARKKQDGLQDVKISVCELTIKEAEQYAEAMKQAFIKHHRECVERKAAMG